MFKGNLFSKRRYSEDFTMIAGPGITGDAPHDGKENKPDIPVAQQQSAPKTVAKAAAPKGSGKASEKEKVFKTKDKIKEAQGQPDGGVVVMEDAFDRLLVSNLHMFFNVKIYLYTRTTSKSHRLCGQNWQLWTHLSKRLWSSLPKP